MKVLNNMKSYINIGWAAVIIASCAVSSCKDEKDEITGPASFLIEEFDKYEIAFTGMDNTTFSNGDQLTVRATGTWTFVPVDEDASAWMQIFPMEGKDDGFIRIFAEENTSAYKRSAQFRLLLNGVEQPEILTFTQGNCKPFLNVSSKMLTFKRAGGELSVTVNANIEWECSVEGTNAASFKCSAPSGTLAVVEAVGPNTSGTELDATLVITGKGEYSDMRQEISLLQLDATFFDNFDWLQSQAGILGWKIATGMKEIRIDNWTDEEKSHGWTSLSTWIYARSGFLKFGKGGYGGDLAAPAVTAIEGPAEVTVSWKALGYGTSKNVKDDIGYYHVALLGAGKITGCSGNGELGYSIPYKDANGNDVTLEAVRFTFDDMAWMIPSIDSTAIDVWQFLTSKFHINISGMDAGTRVVFVSGTGTPDNKYENENAHNSRFFLDDYKVVVN